MIAITATACSSTSGPPEVRSNLQRITQPNTAPGSVAALVGGNSDFAAALHQALASQSGNLVYSPFSISLDMAMLSAGLGGDQQANLDATMQYGLPHDELDPAFDTLDLTLTSLSGKTESGQGKQLSLANAVWSAMTPSSGWLDTLAQYYGAGVLTGSDPGQAIEQWEKSQPGPSLPFQLAGPADLALVDRVALDAAWETKFDASATASANFRRADGSTVSVPFMNQTATLSTSPSGPPAVELPYDGGALSMLIVMPDDLAAYEAGLTGDTIAQLAASLQPASVALSLPKLDFSSSQAILPLLQSMGLGLDSGHWQIWHSARVQLSEAGTQATAMTTVSHTPSAVQQPTPFVVNQPFLFFIREKSTGTLLFGGRVVDPSLS